MKYSIITCAMLLSISPALAQEQSHKMHSEHENAAHDMHEDHNHSDHAHDAHQDDTHTTESEHTAHTKLVKSPEILAALSQGGDAAVVNVLGVVCDFCAKAMNKTFGKKDEVAAVHVDLDTKTLNLVFAPNQSLSDEAIEKLVKKAGYRTSNITHIASEKVESTQ